MGEYRLTGKNQSGAPIEAAGIWTFARVANGKFACYRRSLSPSRSLQVSDAFIVQEGWIDGDQTKSPRSILDAQALSFGAPLEPPDLSQSGEMPCRLAMFA